MLVVPTIATPTQVLTVVLGGQPCRIRLSQKTTGLYLDLYVNDVLIIGGVICEDANPVVRSAYLGFIGDLALYDMRGSEDPTYDGLGTRFILVYLP